MNRILVLIVVILIPITAITYEEKTEVVMYGSTLENAALEIRPQDSGIKDNIKEKNYQVLISNNKDKSDPFYIDLEEYIIGVVAGEMPASFEMEALKAQAIASRTFAMYKMNNIENYVLSTTINDQVYLTVDQMKNLWQEDFDHYYNRIKKAVHDTIGQVMTYNDEIIIAYYFAISNGYTQDAKSVFNEQRDYLQSVSSKWDKNYNSYYSNRTISKSSFCTKLNINCDVISISNIIRDENNYVKNITINDVTFTGQEIFNRLSLKSTDFNLTIQEDYILIETYGFGHGVGMSQYGAQGMANEGYNYQDILKYYYKNIEISKI